MEDLAKKYKMLDEVTHVLKRPGIYIGSVTNTKAECYIPQDGKMVNESIEYSPAILKFVDEIVSNSADEHIRNGSVSTISVTTSSLTGEVSVSDDGGIPVQKHPEHGMYIPSMIFGELRTGSNFGDDERFGAGQNGLGSKLVSIFSKEFKVETSDGKNKFLQTFKNNLSEKSEPTIKKSSEKGTTITFLPDYDRLKCSLSDDNIKRIEKRVYDVAGCNPKIKVYFNNKLIKINNFKHYVEMYADNSVEDYNDNWIVAIAPNENDTFQHISFVNGVDSYNGGTHIDYVTNQITTKLREYIKRKHKIDVKPNNIKQQLMIFINCTINAPMFTSQTKEFMSTDVKDFGTSFEVTDKFINKIIKSGVVQKVLDWAEAQQRQKELADLRKMNKQTQNNGFLKKIVKFDDATSKKREECTLVLTEGDSPSKTILSARDPKTIGVFPLKGKPLNVRDVKVSKLTSNQEFANIMAIIGLKLGEDASIKDLRFSKLLIATDADPDGAHIAGLLINMLQQFWPNLIKEGFIQRLNTPLIVATKGKTKHEFMDRLSYEEWAKTNSKHSMKYYKGLGSFMTKDFDKFLSNEKYHEELTFEDDGDFNSIDLAFDRTMANERKVWLADHSLDMEAS